mgnify:CR=1 FL=1
MAASKPGTAVPVETARHTPGPWVIDEFMSEHGFYKIRRESDALCHVHSFADSDEPTSEATSNARLIAAAPDLLAACEAFEPKMLADTEHRRMVRAAIAKARTP